MSAALSANAQSQVSGAIRGGVRVENQKDRPIPNARVKIVNPDTGYDLPPVRTNAAGEYSFEYVRPGYYDISVEADGYIAIPTSKLSRCKINFDEVSVVNPPPLELRKVGAPALAAPTFPATTATPVATKPADETGLSFKPVVNLSEATRSATFDERVLLSLPLAGNRSFDQLALLVAGVAPSPQAIGNATGPGVGAGVGTSGQFAVNGLRSRGNNFMVDGSDNNDEDIGVRRQGFTTLVPQSVESAEGFRIITALPRSQYGRNMGAQVNAVSRGGTHQIRGSLYGFYTDRRLKARDAFDQINGRDTVLRRANGQPILFDPDGARTTFPLPNPVAGENLFTRGQYGFTLSGPVTKRKTLFFASFERQDLNAGRESHFAVPTVAERGLFGSGETGLTVRTGTTQTRQTFPTTAIGDYYFSLFPFANNPGGPYGRNTYTEQLPASADGTIFSLKLERSFTAYGKSYSLTGRYNFTNDATTLPVTGEAIFSSLRARVRTQNLSLFLTSTFLPSLSNEARFSYGRTRLGFDEVRNSQLLASTSFRNVPFLLNAKCISNSTFPGDSQTSYTPSCFTNDTESTTGTLGQVIVSGYSPLGTDVFNFPQRRVNNTFQFADSLTYNLTGHRVQTGLDVRHTHLNSALDRNFRSVAYFNGSLDTSVGALSRFLTDVPRNFYLGSDFVAAGAATGFLQTFALTPDSAIGLRFWQNNFFATNQISIKPNFKLTVGLRYELNTVPRETNSRIESTFNSPEVQGFIAEERRLFGASGFERYLAGRDGIYDGDHNNLAPYIAFAWDPLGDGKTVVRGGYGIYFDQIPGAVISQSRSVFPRFLTVNLAGIGGQVQNGRIVTTTNPAKLANPGTLNVYNSSNPFVPGSNLLQFLLELNRRAGLPSPNFAASPGFVLPAADLVTPYAQHWSLTIEQEVWTGLLLSLAYVGTKGTHLLRFATPNLGLNYIPVLADGVLRGDQVEFIGTILSPGQNSRRPFPLLGSFTSIEADANSIYHGLQAEASLRLTRGVQFTSAYTWSHAIDEVSDLFDLAGARGLPQNSFNRSAERADANFDVRHRFAQSFIWDLPIFDRSKLWGGWQLAGIVTLQSGQPFTVISGLDVNLDGNLTDRLNTSNGVREVNSGALRFEFPTALQALRALLANAGVDGAVGRNTFHSPGIAVTDVAINKNFTFTETRNLEFRTEIFNLFNRTHFGIPVHTLFAPGLGRAVNTTIPARTVQFGVRYKF